jgi:hypothetical protein
MECGGEEEENEARVEGPSKSCLGRFCNCYTSALEVLLLFFKIPCNSPRYSVDSMSSP